VTLHKSSYILSPRCTCIRSARRRSRVPRGLSVRVCVISTIASGRNGLSVHTGTRLSSQISLARSPCCPGNRLLPPPTQPFFPSAPARPPPPKSGARAFPPLGRRQLARTPARRVDNTRGSTTNSASYLSHLGLVIVKATVTLLGEHRQRAGLCSSTAY
jgi:hypothetical protein